MKNFIRTNLEENYVKSKNLTYKAEDWVTDEWAQLRELPDVRNKLFQVFLSLTLEILE